jgi:hypothetical protein
MGVNQTFQFLFFTPAVDPGAFRAAIAQSTIKTDDLISGLPGEKLVRQGQPDFQSGLHTMPACLVRFARHGRAAPA